MASQSVVVVVLALAAFVTCQTIQLPDYTGPQLQQYSGYIQINTTGRFIHYWLIESEHNPDTAPLVLWTNGGPGCSGLIGLMSEMGPFRAQPGGGLGYTDVAWTQFANMLFVEQPAGVGFSYFTNSADRRTSDTKAAEDNFAFISEFLKKFPKYVGRKTWLTGESYGGRYIPMMAQKIVENPSTQISKQLEGIMVGNPTIECGIERAVNEIPHLFFHGLISYAAYSNWTKNDCGAKYPVEPCETIYRAAIRQVGQIGQPLAADNYPSLNRDALYYDFCTGNGTLDFSIQEQGHCNPSNDLTSAYLSRKDVQTALNVQVTGKWSPCGGIEYDRNGPNMNDVYKALFSMRPTLKVLIYSGDVDMLTVPHCVTQACLGLIESPLEVEWQPWFVNGETAGYVEQRAHYTYCTIKGAGHEAPQYQPLNSLAMFSRFLSEGKLTGPQHNAKVIYRKSLTQGDVLRAHRSTHD